MFLFQDFRAAFQKKNNALIQIILLNISVFLLLILLKVVFTLAGFDVLYSNVVSHIGLPANLSAIIYQPWSLLLYSFVHEDPFHILSNMLFLYWFGRLIDEFIGSSRVISLYVLGALAGGFLYILMYNFIPYFTPNLNSSLMIGASGATFAIVWGAATLLPDYVFRLLFIGDVRIKYIAWFYLVLSFAQIIGVNAGGNIAHLGGALLGYVYIKMLQNGRDLGNPIHWFIRKISNLISPKPLPTLGKKHSFSEISINKDKPFVRETYIEQHELDIILDKISTSGYESLSIEEKQKLFKASKQ